MGVLIRVGTRRSALAKVQTAWVADRLRASDPSVSFETVEIATTGDHLKGSLADAGGKGLFVKELEDALLAGRIDLAVHSVKDLPGELAGGLDIACVPAREDPRDVLLTRDAAGGIRDLPAGARLGTASPRRRAQVLALRRDLVILPMRGNVDTRLRKLREGEVEALILAAAGLKRLYGQELSPQSSVLSPELKVCFLSQEEMLPAVGQGALGLEIRATDQALRGLTRRIEDPRARLMVDAERAFLRLVGGDCYTPLAALGAPREDGAVSLEAGLWSEDGSRGGRARAEGTPDRAAGEAYEQLSRYA